MTIKTLKDGTQYVKANNYKGRDLTGVYDVYIKIDGVRAMRNAEGEVVSRAGKPLYNLDHLTFQDAEIFSVDWATSTSLVRTQTPTVITQEMVYEISNGNVDERLYIMTLHNPTCEQLVELMSDQLDEGHEGIVIRCSEGKWTKLVPERTADIRITGYKEGTGKNTGMLGSFQTEHGSVGTGLTDEMRIDFWGRKDEMIGKIIEVSFRETYEESGKLRFPAFQRERFDKDDESL